MKIGDWLQIAQKRLAQKHFESPHLDASLLAAHALGISRSEVLAHPELSAPSILEQLLERRLSGEPIAYILGSREFYGRDFCVDRRVLIPRPETETLVEAAASRIPKGAIVLDLGTGSGAIAITLLLERPDVIAIAGDKSVDAMEVARENALRQNASVSLLLMDGMAAIRSNSLDAIVSNPPYIDPGDPRIEDSARSFEPHLALFSEGGIAFMERMIVEAHRVLKPGGALLFEFGEGQREEVAGRLTGWDEVAFICDLSGRDRVAFATKPSL